jgi:hypothetical protein
MRNLLKLKNMLITVLLALFVPINAYAQFLGGTYNTGNYGYGLNQYGNNFYGGVVSRIAILQETSKYCIATSCSLAFPNSVGSGHLLVYITGDASPGLTASTDNNGNTVANALTYTFNGLERVDYVSSSNSGATTVTGNASQSGQIHLHIWEISGLAGTLDASNTGHASSTSLTISTSTSTSANNEVVLGFFFNALSNSTFTAGSGYANYTQTNDSTDGDSGLSEGELVTTTGTQTATAAVSPSSSVDEIIVTFK